ncbi:GDYXXLXY domain-containing protein [Sporosarcina sp. GW1-11]|uniref:GDYXXLXY domain-containing protein n=1 Tax=Sporosarcina sp. GW1-11 TaxID=2899126 RepID=UPI00294CDB3F|nr:GDYXXLXY domain-containing protein [Sporosarcina sp. GW1-11]MDV6377183.1 GDYXXLXY domain-containing protein [Sporosarcina sp. GW1-11]
MSIQQNKHSKISVAILFIIPLLVLASLTIPHFTTITTGTDVYLQTEPITKEDANENYIVLHYEVEKVPKERLSDSLVARLKAPAELGQTKVFGVLEKRDGVDQLIYLSEKQPTEGVYLAGWLPQTTEREYRESDHYIVNFGLDRFYVLKKGHRVAADSLQGATTTAHFKVRDGHGILRAVETK